MLRDPLPALTSWWTPHLQQTWRIPISLDCSPWGAWWSFFWGSAESSTLHIVYREIIYIKELGFLPASLKRILTGSISHALQVVKPTLRTNHISSLSTYSIYIYTHIWTCICVYVCVYTCTCAYSGGETHTLTKSHFAVIHNIYIFEPIYMYTFVSVLVCGRI